MGYDLTTLSRGRVMVSRLMLTQGRTTGLVQRDKSFSSQSEHNSFYASISRIRLIMAVATQRVISFQYGFELVPEALGRITL